MFVRREKRTKDSFTKHRNDSFNSKHRAGKSASVSKQYTKRSFKDPSTTTKRSGTSQSKTSQYKLSSPSSLSKLNSPILTLSIGPSSRLFAAHESILLASPYFSSQCRWQFLSSDPSATRINLPEEIPEVFSSVLEFLYKGDYTPKLAHSKRSNAWTLDLAPNALALPPAERGTTVYHDGAGMELLKDTLVYCAAERYGLPELKRLALRKQGLQTGVSVGVILGSARYAYENTGEEDSKLRAHYLALIVRSREVFKRSGTMQGEMERGGGGGLWFDLFVAMCNHLDDLAAVSKSPRTPKTM